MKIARFKKPKPSKADIAPTFGQTKIIMATVLPNVVALMAVVSYAAHKSETAKLTAALAECGYTDPKTLLGDIEVLLPFMSAAVNDLVKFRSRVMEVLK